MRLNPVAWKCPLVPHPAPSVEPLRHEPLAPAPHPQEHRHPDRRCLPGAGHTRQAGPLAVHLPAAHLRGAGALPGENRMLSGLHGHDR